MCSVDGLLQVFFRFLCETKSMSKTSSSTVVIELFVWLMYNWKSKTMSYLELIVSYKLGEWTVWSMTACQLLTLSLHTLQWMSTYIKVMVIHLYKWLYKHFSVEVKKTAIHWQVMFVSLALSTYLLNLKWWQAEWAPGELTVYKPFKY